MPRLQAVGKNSRSTNLFAMCAIPHKSNGFCKLLGLIACPCWLLIIGGTTALAQTNTSMAAVTAQAAVLARLNEIQNAAQSLDVEKVFSYVLENDSGAVAQNGRLFLARQEALESTRRGFEALQKVEYKFDQQHITLLAPTVALAVGEGTSTAKTKDDQSFTTHFVQSVTLILTNGQWKVFHAHRSFSAVR